MNARHHRLNATASVLALFSGMGAVPAMAQEALPGGGNVVAGAAIISTPNATTTRIDQSTKRAVIDWRTFGIAQGSRVDFVQSGVDAATLNRVTGSATSVIAGQLTATGSVYLINPNGIQITKDGAVQVGRGFVASTLDIGNDDFMAGRGMVSGAGGAIMHDGTITTGSGGFVGLLGSNIDMSGSIVAPAGTVTIGATTKATLDLNGDGFLQVAAPSNARVSATGGMAQVSVGDARDAVRDMVNLPAQVDARFASGKNGVITLGGAVYASSEVVLSGTIDVSAPRGPENTSKGGNVTVRGGSISQGGGIFADGDTGGAISLATDGMLSLAGTISAQGTSDKGGSVSLNGGMLIQNASDSIDVSGRRYGGTISGDGSGQFAASGRFAATGFIGGRIDVSGGDLRLLSSTFDASGVLQGGLVRLGGAFAGGASGTVSDALAQRYVGRWGSLASIRNAATTFVNDGVMVNVSGMRGGTAVAWSDVETTMLGSIAAFGAGSIEISSKATLRRADLMNVETGLGGHLLLDPKNIIIGDRGDISGWLYQGVLQIGAPPVITTPVLRGYDIDGLEISPNASPQFGYGRSLSISADGSILAVGSAGFTKFAGRFAFGGVFVFRFGGANFASGRLASAIGAAPFFNAPTNVEDGDNGLGLGGGLQVALSGNATRLAVGISPSSSSSDPRVVIYNLAPTTFLATRAATFTSDTSASYNSVVALDFSGTRLAIGGSTRTGPTNDASASIYNLSADGTTRTLVADFRAGATGANDINFSGSNFLSTSGLAFSNSGSILALASVSGEVSLFRIGSGTGSSLVSRQATASRSGTLLSVALNEHGTRMAVGNEKEDTVSLFGLSADRTSRTLLSTLAPGASGPNDLDISSYAPPNGQSNFGQSVSLTADARQLVVGDSLGKLRGEITNNNGEVQGNEPTGSGRILMYTFADGNFTGGGLRGVFDRGVAPLGDDASGSALALSADGTQLAVGAPAASGGRGQVNLYKFSNSNFQGGRLRGSIGAGLTGVGNLNISSYTNPTDAFGLAVALTPDGRGLAVGAPFSSGRPGTAGGALSGAVFIYRFDDNAFGTPTRGPTIGVNYNDAGDVNMFGRSRTFDQFGSAVALSGAGTLIVGAPGHSGFSANAPGSGALFGFGFDTTGAPFTNLAQFGVMGAGYNGAGNDNTAIDPQAPLLGIGKALALTANGRGLVYSNASNNFVEQYLLNSARSFSSGFLRTLIPTRIREGDGFGTSLAYSSDGTRLAIGAAQHDGAGGDATQSGAVYLFTQSNMLTSTTLAGIIGRGYGSRDQINTTGYINDGSLFGTAVALNGDGTRLAVGAALQNTVVDGIATTTGTWLYRFNDGFTNGALVRGISREFGTDGLPTDLGSVRSGDTFGSAVALSADATKLAVGTPGSDGASGTVTDSGSVFLYRFNGSDFRAGVLVGAIGRGYTGSGNLNTDGFSVTGDNFGASVAFNSDGTRLAVGAPNAAGVTGNSSRTGSAYVFTFDDQLQNGVLRSILAANGFSFNTDSRLRSGDQFGSAVALDGAGFRLGVGARFHGGTLNDAPESGGVFLFDLNATDGNVVFRNSLTRTAGSPYDTSAFVRNFDAFGSSLAMSADGLRLLVGTPFSRGATTGTTNTGSVFAYNFSDTALSSATLAKIGSGFTAAGDIDTSGIVRNGDLFGSAVGLSRDGLSFVVGAPQATGASSNAPATGSVFAFTFPSSGPDAGSLISSFGRGYTGANNIDTSAYVRNGDSFGSALALNGSGNRLVVGAPFNGGNTGTLSNSGAVFFYNSINPFAGNIRFGDTTQRISATSLADLLGRGTSITLQASNDISILQSINVQGTGGGSLTLQAGRSIIASSGINLSTANGTLSLTANETADKGVIAAQRDAGAALLDVSGATITAGTGGVNLTMTAGTGAGGEIRLGTISAASLNVINQSNERAATTLGGDITTTGTLALPDAALIIRANSVLSSTTGVVTWAGEATRAITGVVGGETIAFVQGSAQTRFGVLDTNDAARLGVVGGSSTRVYGDANPALGGLALQRGTLRGSDTLASLVATGSLRTTFDAGNVAMTSNVGSYDFSVAPNANFTLAAGKAGYFSTLTPARGALSITPRSLFFVADQVSRIYGDTNPSLLQNGRFSGLVNQDDIDSVISGNISVSTTATQTSNVGSYGIQATGVAVISSNYVFAQAPGNATALTITPRLLTATARASSRIYGDANPIFSGTLDNLANGDSAASIFSALAWTSTTDGKTGLGRFAINATGTLATANYTLTQAVSNATALTITPRALTITATNAQKTYGAIFDTRGAGFTTLGLVNSDEVTSITAVTDANVATAAVGSYAISLSSALGIGLSNYAINYVTGTVTVTPATLLYKAETAFRIYGAANSALTGSVSGFVNGETLASATSGTFAFSTTAQERSHVGRYAIAGSGLSAGNYVFAQDPTNANAFIITPRALSVTADTKSRIYGDANPLLTFTTGNDNLLSGDTLDGALATSALTRSNVGTYAITQGTLANPNYAITFIGNLMSVTPRALTIAGNSLSKIYGDTVAISTTNFVVSGLVSSDSVSEFTIAGSDAGAIGANVGRYAFTSSNAQGTGLSNYIIDYRPGSMSVTPRTLTYSSDLRSRMYGDVNPLFTGGVSGFVLGQNITNATSGTLSFTSRADVTSNVGQFVLQGSGLTANFGNYIFVQDARNATALTILPRTLTVTADAKSRIYGDPNLSLTFSTNGLVNGDIVTGALETRADVTSNVGTYAITQGTILGTSNYHLTYVGADLVVTPRPVTLTAHAASRLYGRENPVLGFTAAGLLNGDVVTGSLTTNAILTSNVGSYEVTQGSATASPNYAIRYVGTALTITPETLKYIADLINRPYLVPTRSLTGQVSGFVLDDTLANATSGTPTFTTAAGPQSLPGIYPVTGGGLTANNGNYIFAQDPQNINALTINPRAHNDNMGSQLLGPRLPNNIDRMVELTPDINTNDIEVISLRIADGVPIKADAALIKLCTLTRAGSPNSCDTHQSR